MLPLEELIPFRNAIQRLGMGLTWAYSEVAAGRLAIVKNGRRTFVRASELARYIDALSAGNGPKTP